jgi:thioredoxin-related protein
MGPRWKKVEADNPWLETEYFEFDDSPEITEKYGLKSTKLPVFIFLDKEGNEIERMHGELPEKKLIEKINEHKDK